MMKKITLLFLTLLIVSLGYAQTNLATYSFDDASSITGWTGVADAGGADASGTNPLASIAFNATGNGTGALEISGVGDGGGKAFIFELLNTGFDYQGSGSINISFDAKFVGAYENAAFHFQTLTSGPGLTNFFDQQNKINDATWSTIAVDLDGIDNSNTDLKMSFQIACGAILNAGGTVLIDNIIITGTVATCTDGIQNGDETGVDCGGSCPNACVIPAPLVSAPLSTTPESDVLFLYSDVYTTPANQVAFNNANWMNPAGPVYGTSTEEVITGTSDNVRYISDLTVGFAGITQTDFSDYDYFHIDIWSDESTFIIVKWEGAGAGLSGQESVALTPNEWTSVDIDLNTYGSLASDRTTLFQMVFDATTGKDYYIDNVYFSKTSFVFGTEDLELASFSAYPNPTQDSWTVRTENSNMSSIKVFDILGKTVLSLAPNASETVIDGSTLKSGLYFAQIKTEAGINSIKLIKN